MATLAQGAHPLIRSTLHTPESVYTAPEQSQGGERHPASDVYSLSAIAYELLTGAVPFPSLDAATVLVKQLNQTPPPPTTLNSTLPPACDAVLLKALARHPLERYPQGGAFIDALETALDTATTPVSPPQPTRTPAATTRLQRSGTTEETQVSDAPSRGGAILPRLRTRQPPRAALLPGLLDTPERPAPGPTSGHSAAGEPYAAHNPS